MRIVPGLRRGPFRPDDGLVVAWRTPSSSAKFALFPRPDPRTKNCAAVCSSAWSSLSLASRLSLPLLLPDQRSRGGGGQSDLFYGIIKSDGLMNVRRGAANREQLFLRADQKQISF